MIRLFLTSSHLSSVLAALIARKISARNDKAYLVIDNTNKKEALIELITQTQSIYNWDHIFDFSKHVADQADLKPGLRKTITRKLKNARLISPVYSLLLSRHNRQYVQKKSKEIEPVLMETLKHEPDEIYLLTQTNLNAPLLNLYKKARIIYYEHGLGDYYYFYHQKLKGSFYGLFGNEFSEFIEKNTHKKTGAFGNFEKSELDFAFSFYFPLLEKKLSGFKNKKCILFLMDSLEIYNPPEEFWTDYLTNSLAEIPDHKDYLLIVKPHPNQSNGVIEKTRNFLKDEKISFVLLDDPIFVSMSVEIVFSYLKDEVRFMISTFSSAVFYLAKYYPENCEYILMYDFVEKYIQNAPKQYMDHYKGFDPFIKEIFLTEKIKRIH